MVQRVLVALPTINTPLILILFFWSFVNIFEAVSRSDSLRMPSFDSGHSYVVERVESKLNKATSSTVDRLLNISLLFCWVLTANPYCLCAYLFISKWSNEDFVKVAHTKLLNCLVKFWLPALSLYINGYTKVFEYIISGPMYDCVNIYTTPWPRWPSPNICWHFIESTISIGVDL